MSKQNFVVSHLCYSIKKNLNKNFVNLTNKYALNNEAIEGKPIAENIMTKPWKQAWKYKNALNVCKPNIFITRSAVDLAFKKHAHGDKHILTLHGLLGSKRNWDSMSKRLAVATNSTTIAVDLRNHGESPHTSTHTYPELAADVSQLMTKQNIKEATLVGHSMGGRTAMVLALTEPTKVTRLILADISPVTTPAILNDLFPALINAMVSVNFDSQKNISEARNSAKQQLSNVMDPSGLGFILLNIGEKNGKIGWTCNPLTLKNEFMNIATFPTDAMSGKTYNGPTLFVAGELSNYCPASDINGIRNYFPKANIVTMKNVGHNVHAEDPNTFFDIVSNFIKTT